MHDNAKGIHLLGKIPAASGAISAVGQGMGARVASATHCQLPAVLFP